jgi:hypothetical protein
MKYLITTEHECVELYYWCSSNSYYSYLRAPSRMVSNLMRVLHNAGTSGPTSNLVLLLQKKVCETKQFKFEF